MYIFNCFHPPSSTSAIPRRLDCERRCFPFPQHQGRGRHQLSFPTPFPHLCISKVSSATYISDVEAWTCTNPWKYSNVWACVRLALLGSNEPKEVISTFCFVFFNQDKPVRLTICSWLPYSTESCYLDLSIVPWQIPKQIWKNTARKSATESVSQPK